MTNVVHATLTGHPANPPSGVLRIGVTLLQKPDGSLTLAYSIDGPASFLHIPTRTDPAPADALWRTTCCELFLAADDGTAYREFNFSPSGQWATYDFTTYREAAATASRIAAPKISTGNHGDRLRLDAVLPAASLPAGSALRCALAVVVESHDGNLGFWALAHPPGPPDFHHRDGFTLYLDKARFPT
jgi:hypothetical protein